MKYHHERAFLRCALAALFLSFTFVQAQENPSPEPGTAPETAQPEAITPEPEKPAPPATGEPSLPVSDPATDSTIPPTAPTLTNPELAPILSPDQNAPESDSIFSVEPDISLVPQDQQYPLALPANPPPSAPLVYPVSKFNFKYAPEGREAKAKLPSLDTLTTDPLTLGKSAEALVPPGKGTEDIPVSLPSLAPKTQFSPDALREVFATVQKRLNDQNIFGVLVSADPAQIDGETLQDKRVGTPQANELTVLVYVGEIKQVRTVTKRVKFRETDPPAIDEPRYARIKSESPLQAGSGEEPGSVLDKKKLQNYLSRVNRFPGRRVDVAVNASGEPGGVILDYLIREDKNWTVYAQSSNTGTETTGQWRTQVGVQLRQLAKLDDIFDLDYTTSDLTSSNNLNAAYQVTPIFPDVLKAKIYGSYGKFTASDVGFDFQNFEGESWKIGGLLTWTPIRIADFPLDITGGLEWVDVNVVNNTFLGEGQGEFLLAYVGLGTEKKSDRFSAYASTRLVTNLSAFTDTDESDLGALGRFSTDNDFYILQFGLGTSFFIEPLFLGDKFRTPNEIGTWSLAHEFVFNVRGQFTFDDQRLIPQFEETIGGFYSVRGYPEALAAGDNVYIATAEYRLHIPRLFPLWKAPEGSPDGTKQNVAGLPFALQPTAQGEGLAQPDWDLIFRLFADFGYNENNQIQVSSEVDRTLLGVGAGLELQIKNNFSLRVDYGVALIEQDELLLQPITEGSGRLHISAALVW